MKNEKAFQILNLSEVLTLLYSTPLILTLKFIFNKNDFLQNFFYMLDKTINKSPKKKTIFRTCKNNLLFKLSTVKTFKLGVFKVNFALPLVDKKLA